MDIVMHCGGTPFNGDTLKTSSLGGSESAAYYMAKELADKGHNVILFTNHQEGGVVDGVSYIYAGPISNETPLGIQFNMYATNTPHDVLIIQRSAAAFIPQYASKVNILWLHDLALYRQKDLFGMQMWNVDAIFTVSEYHKKQVCEVYGVNPDIVLPITNGVDLGLYKGTTHKSMVPAFLGRTDNPSEPAKDGYGLEDLDEYDAQIKLIYSSRPERGLENLVMPNGIMDKLYDINPKFHLYVCTYDNTSEQMRPLYEMLWQRCSEMPNVTNLSSLTKQELADVQRQCTACVYPTEFEEVSCITAMETMAAEIHFIASSHAALPETCKDSGAMLVSLSDGNVDVDEFVRLISNLTNKKIQHKLNTRIDKQRAKSKTYSWESSASKVISHIETLFGKNRDVVATTKHMLKNSDIIPLSLMVNATEDNPINDAIADEIAECYAFMSAESWKDHYEKYYEYEKARGVEYGPEDVTGTLRFQAVSNLILESFIAFNATSNGGSDKFIVLDYGCAHGHYTINLAKKFPDIDFIGVDIAASNIDIAEHWAKSDGIENVIFFQGEIAKGGTFELYGKYDSEFFADYCAANVTLAAEVLEHVPNPDAIVNALRKITADNGRVIITTPYGGWEAIGYKEHWPWRAHVWHFERGDIQRIFSHLMDFKVITVPSGMDKTSANLGSYVYTFSPDREKLLGVLINTTEKIRLTVPRQTISLCMIVVNSEDCILRSLKSAGPYVDEVVIGLDEKTTDSSEAIITKYCTDNKIALTLFSIKSPLETGFDVARNHTLDAASGQWILWMDADEILHTGENLDKYLRNNQFSGYAIKQHHMAVEPLGCLKTDMPCRVFRNNIGVSFYGVVHEHPEIKLNDGIGYVNLLRDVCIEHSGYPSEAIRRKRFERNFGLMARDREKYPKRHLGKFLWIRDMAQLNTYELQQNGSHVTEVMRQRAVNGIALWEEILEAGQIRMLLDGMNYYTALVAVLGAGFDFSFSVKASKLNGGADINTAKVISAQFLNTQHLSKLMSEVTEMEVKNYGSRYY